MKRFYKQAAVAPVEGGFTIQLDGRQLKTPARKLLLLPGQGLADAIAGEWNRQGDKVDPRSMPFTGLANAAIDRVAPDPAAFARSLAIFAESDLLCYRAESPDALVRRQADRWDPLLDWARRRFDVEFETAGGIMHVAQPARTIDQLSKTVGARNPFQLAGLSPLVTIAGSLLIALALDEEEIRLEEAWAAATIDEAWQAEKWGEDELASAAIEAKRLEFEAAYRFLRLL